MAKSDTDSTSSTGRRACPLCAELIQPAAIICPHCRGHVGTTSHLGVHRNRPGKQIAGVSVALADQLGISVTLVRLGFIVATFVSFSGPLIYALLWLVLPAEPGGRSILEGITGPLSEERDGDPSILERGLRESQSIFERVIAWVESKTSKRTTEETP